MTAETNNILPIPFTQFFISSGAVNAGGTVFTYAADGATLKTTYQGPGSTIANTNPIVLNSAGQALIWGQGQYVFSVYDVNGNLQYSYPTQDPEASIGVSPAMLPVLQATTLAVALALLGGQPAGTGMVPWGVPLPFAGNTAPSGFALCYGQAVSRTLYPNLFTAIGTTWGTGDGSTTYNLPDLRGRIWAGADAMGGSAANVLTNAASGFNQSAILGASGGSQYIFNHTHGITDPGHVHSLISVLDNVGPLAPPLTGGFATYINIRSNPTASAVTGITVNSFGEGNSGNVQPTAVGNWIIGLG